MIFFSDFLVCYYNLFNFFYFLENIYIQLTVLYIIFLYFSQNNIYYSLLYFFYLIVLYGLFLCLIQCEFFTGFLWVTEFTVIFIALILIFYLNVDGLKNKQNYKINNIYNSMYYFILLIFIYRFNYFIALELNKLEWLNFYFLYEDYYEALNNTYMNDFSPLYISYYMINSLILLLMGYILYIASFICVRLYKNNKKNQWLNFSYFYNTLKLNFMSINYSFLKKQNLFYQANLKPSLFIFNNKV